MAEGTEHEDKTEAPSPRRLEKARADGQAPLSSELPALAVLGAAAVVMMAGAPGVARGLVGRLSVMLDQAHRLDAVAALRSVFGLVAMAAAPLVLAALVSASAAVLLQTGFLMNRKALVPDLARLDPRRGLARVFGTATLFEAAKSVVKVVVVGYAGWSAMTDALPMLQAALTWDAARLIDRTLRLVLHIMLAMLAAQGMIAALDIFRVRFRHMRQLRMSREELREESREMEGDPQVKGRLKRIRMQRARRRMLSAVPKATVVVTNPTHYAVALAYARDSSAAPRIVAKGVDAMAARIRAVASEHGVPIVANPPLARALYPHPLDREIPAEYFKPVAEIIAYVWRLRGRAA